VFYLVAKSAKSNNSDSVVRKALVYMGEWIDSASEKMTNLSESSSDIKEAAHEQIRILSSLEQRIFNQQDKLSKLEEQVTLMDDINERMTSQDERINRLEMNIDKLLNAIENWDDSELSVKMDKIEKPIRKAADITRGRMADVNLQGKREAQSERYARSVTAQRMIGIRRAELGNLTMQDLVVDESGELCVLVKKGKGGKKQLQVILPDHMDDVRRIFEAARAAGLSPDSRLFTAKEMANKIDYHSLRADLAREAYAYYLAEVKAGHKDALKARLAARWNACHEARYQIVKTPSGRYVPAERKNSAKTSKFCRELNTGTEYLLRGDNRTKALADGSLGHYDRVAMLCVSVFHLSHWRNDVTASHYML
jgi:hypothetical protein